MLTENVTYENFDGKTVTETLYFNLSKTELADNLHLQARFETLERIFKGPERDLTMPEVQQMLDLIKEMMRLSYGERSEDGRYFRKSPQIWSDFQSTAAYDSFLFSLFENPEKGINFLLGVFPKDLVDGAKAQVEAATEQTVQLPTAEPVLEPSSEVETEVTPSGPTDEQLLKMDPDKMTTNQLRRLAKLQSQK